MYSQDQSTFCASEEVERRLVSEVDCLKVELAAACSELVAT